MDYIELTLSLNNSRGFENDIVSATLAEIGFESFVYTNDGLKAYCAASLFDEKELNNWKVSLPCNIDVEYNFELIRDKNWNEEWEKHYFSPIIIGNECVIHSSFHTNVPKARYDILIDPKMSFGTGHHETTSLIIGELIKMNVAGKSLLDMGCGTGVLAILADMKGAKPITAIDIDEWAYKNTVENIRLNSCPDIKTLKGGAELLDGQKFDIILANINRNILLSDMKQYAACLSTGGLLLMSGFYKTDMPAIESEANENGLTFVKFEEKNNWVTTVYEKR
ncbi:MAG: ribosomal protein L11P-lysine N-methyltransferase [Bacteroidetes bacterium]|nr:ribosomal protein L11P-lysine N-methyltransferase [Bacteroidota bacterium]